MTGILVEITKFVDDSQPGFVECCFVDASGRQRVFIEKIPLVTLAELDENSDYPQEGIVACQIVKRQMDTPGRGVVIVNTRSPWGIDLGDDEYIVEVTENQLVEFDWSKQAMP